MDYTVITICRNAEATLSRTVESVLSQTPAPRRYVLVDGGSTDGTRDILARTRTTGAEAGVDVKVLAQPTPGPQEAGIPTAWNCGLRHVVGDLVFLLNADDWYDEGAAAAVVAQFDRTPLPDIVAVPVRLCGADGRPTGKVLRPRPLGLLPVLMPLAHPGTFVRATLYDEVGPFDPTLSISADYDFVYRCHRAGKRFGFGTAPLVNMQTGGLAAQRRGVARYETLQVARRYGRWPVLPELAFALRTLLGR